MGRPTRLTKAIREKIYQGIRLGLPYERAAQLAGIHQSTFYMWKRKGMLKKAPIYIKFLEELKKAEVEGEAAAINEIVKAARGSDKRPAQWQAAAWMLERRFPDRWARIQKLELSWQNEVVNLVRNGVVTFDDVSEELGDELARELFESAGIQVTAS